MRIHAKEEHGPGMLFTSTDGLKWEPLGKTAGGTLEYDVCEYEPTEGKTFTTSLEPVEIEMDMVGDSDPSLMWNLINREQNRLRSWRCKFVQLNSYYPRITHLALYTRKLRTKKKNMRRYVKMLLKERRLRGL
jgi:hypothetical protein